MKTDTYKYIIVGGGLAGVSAAEGIREKDKDGSIAIFEEERHLPYDRPPLSKKLWTGKTTLEKIFLHDRRFYEDNGIELCSGTVITALDAAEKTLTDDSANTYRYEKLLLATGGRPRPLLIPGAHLEGLCYYRYLDDYQAIRTASQKGGSALVIGGGFIGSELAAGLAVNGTRVTMLFPGQYLCGRVLPEKLAAAVQAEYVRRGVRIVSGRPAEIEKKKGKFVTRTENGETIASDFVLAGLGITPETSLAQAANLFTDNGIAVNAHLQTSDPDIYAAGDNANFPCKALGRNLRMEHWDNAGSQGRQAGRNMAGAGEPFEYLPYFFSDLFDFGYEAVGEIDPRLRTVADWQEENRKGIVYYLNGDTIRGVLLCNVWDRVPAARRLVQDGAALSDAVRAELSGKAQAVGAN